MLSADEEADFWVLYKKTSEELFRKAFRMCRGNRADADDAHQSAYLKALKNWHTVASLDDGRRRRWLVTTLTREVLQLWRERQWWWTVDISGTTEWLSPTETTTPETDSIDEGHKDRYGQVCQAIAQLTGRKREVVAMHCLAGYEISEIAEMLGLAPATVRVHLHAGRLELRRVLAGKEPEADE